LDTQVASSFLLCKRSCSSILAATFGRQGAPAVCVLLTLPLPWDATLTRPPVSLGFPTALWGPCLSLSFPGPLPSCALPLQAALSTLGALTPYLYLVTPTVPSAVQALRSTLGGRGSLHIPRWETHDSHPQLGHAMPDQSPDLTTTAPCQLRWLRPSRGSVRPGATLTPHCRHTQGPGMSDKRCADTSSLHASFPSTASICDSVVTVQAPWVPRSHTNPHLSPTAAIRGHP
jgi:hypothetical protein